MPDPADLDLADSVADAPLVPGIGANQPFPSAPEVWMRRLEEWVRAVDDATDEQRDCVPGDLMDAVDLGRAWLAAHPAPATEVADPELLEAVQDAFARLYPDGQVTEEDALGALAGLTARVCCPDCGGYQVYDLAAACRACGGARWEACSPATGQVVAEFPDLDGRPQPVVGYDIRLRFRCADPLCVQYGSACSRCGGEGRAGAACAECGTSWPRWRSRWATEPRGACGGRDGSDPDHGCGWVRA